MKKFVYILFNNIKIWNDFYRHPRLTKHSQHLYKITVAFYNMHQPSTLYLRSPILSDFIQKIVAMTP